MDNHENTDRDNRIDEIKDSESSNQGLYEKSRSILENSDITSFVEKNFGAIGKEYYDRMKESYLR